MLPSICSSRSRIGRQLISSFHPRLLHCSRVSQTRPPLLQLQSAIIPGLGSTDQTSTLDWTVNDAGSSEAWGVTGPAAERGGAVKADITKALLGLSRLRQVSSDGEIVRHPLTHPFLRGSSQSTSSAIQLVSFSARLSSVGSAASNSFVDFSTRYGAIREEDRITLYESLMKAMGTQTGLVAKISLFPDPLRDPVEEAKEDFANGVTRLPWSSQGAEVEARRRAKENHQRIMDLAPLLNLSHGDPPLLERPMIALSNGQTRRARIMSALCVGCEVLVLEEPFTGLDPPTRTALSNLLADLHAHRRPRVVCVLREQDELPPFLTHVLSIGEEGNVLFNGPIRGTPKTAADLLDVGKTQFNTKGGYEVVKQQAAKGVGRGDERSMPAVELKNVSIAYKGKKVLDNVSLTLPTGSRTILVGDNGSGKTTLLSLLLGSHPQSYSLPSTSLTLFGSSRSDPPNATPLLLRRMGQLSPELVNAFPRRGLERGGLSVRDAVGSGFEGIFTRRARTTHQEERIERLVGRFQGVIASSKNQSQAMDNLTSLLETPFHQLTPGSQTLILFLRSIVHSPRLLVLDEPFQGMSSSQVSHVRSFLDGEDNSPTRAQGLMTDQEREEEKQWLEGTAIVLVSHFEEEWLRGAGRLIRLKEGKAVESI